MLRVSKHKLSDVNQGKLSSLDSLFKLYRHNLDIYIDYIITGVLPLKMYLSSKELPTELIQHSNYKRDLYIKASEIIRSQLDKAKKKN